MFLRVCSKTGCSIYKIQVCVCVPLHGSMLSDSQPFPPPHVRTSNPKNFSPSFSILTAQSVGAGPARPIAMRDLGPSSALKALCAASIS